MPQGMDQLAQQWHPRVAAMEFIAFPSFMILLKVGDKGNA